MVKTTFQSVTIILTVLLLVGCDRFPKDPEDTLKHAQNGMLRVGYSENKPFVIKTNSTPKGIEPKLVIQYANSINARIVWKDGGLDELLKLLEDKKIDMVIGGIDKNTPWKTEKIGLSRPYQQDGNRVIAIPQGENEFLSSLERFLMDHKTK